MADSDGSGQAADGEATPRTGPPRRSSRVRRVVHSGGPPTHAFGVRRPGSGLSQRAELEVLDLALRTGEAMLGTGAGVADVTAAMQRMAGGLGLTGCQVDITFNSITVSIDRDDGATTRVRVLQMRTSDYSRLAAVAELVDDCAAGRVRLPEAVARLDAIVSAPHPYARWVVTLALGAMAGGVAVLLGGGWQVAVLAAATTAVIDRTQRFLRRLGLPNLFQQAVGSAIPTLVALVLLWGAGRFGWDVAVLPPSLVVASGIVVLLAGLSLVGAAEDAISGFPVTAGARSFEVVLNTLGIVVGVGIVLDVGARLGVPLTITDFDGFETSFGVRLAAAAVVAGSFAVASYARLRIALLVAVIGSLGTTASILIETTGAGPATRSFMGALAVGVVAGLVARRRTAPAIVLTVCGITPMLPGLAIYGAMFAIVQSGNVLSGATLALRAVAIGLSLAAGVSLGDFMARTYKAQADRWHDD